MKKNTSLNKWLALKKKRAAETGIPKMPAEMPIPLSRGQERLWLLQKLYPKNPFYQYAHGYRITGNWDIEKLVQAFQSVMDRHEVLRTNFLETENGAVQIIHPEIKIPVEIIESSGFPSKEREAIIEKTCREKATELFDLENDPLIRLTILKLAKDDYFLLFSIHHIIGDRWSLQILNEEVATAYREAKPDNGSDLSASSPDLNADRSATLSGLTMPKIQYSDYSYWQRQQADRPEDLEYWLKKLEGNLPILSLPSDYQRPIKPTFRGASISRDFSPNLSEKIKAFSKKENTTPFAVMLSAYQVLLYRLSGQDDLLIGAPFTNRDKKSLEKLIGFFNETLVLRADLSDDPTFSELLAQNKRTVADAFLHKNTSFDTLVRELKPARNGTANPLFQVMFLYNALQKMPEFAPGLKVEESVVDLGVSKFDLTLFVTDHGEKLSTTFEYAADLFEAETIEQMQAHFRILIENIVENPEKQVSKLEVLSDENRKEILVGRNLTSDHPLTPSEGGGTLVSCGNQFFEKKKIAQQSQSPLLRRGLGGGQPESVLSLFEKQVEKNPDALCAVFENKKLTYGEVNHRAEILADELIKKGVSPGDVVGLQVHRSTDLHVGIVGIMKAGAAYLPLDPEYPAERIEYMIQDSGCKLKVEGWKSESEIEKTCQKRISTIFLTEDLYNRRNNFQPPTFNLQPSTAYIIYTSGSTGKPKGVPITHRNLLISTAARFKFYKKNPSAFLLLSSYSFDSSVAGIFWTLTTGGALVVPKKRIEQDVENLAEIISKNQISHTLMLPSLYNLLLEHAPVEKLQSLNTIMVAGEACASTVVRQHFKTLPAARLYNEYGPTEGTVWCTAHEIRQKDAEGIIPIGRPIPNVQNYILDRNLQPVPDGVASELYIGGETLSSGYLNRPELTAEKFVTTFFKEITDAEGQPKPIRLYRTGDLARYRKDGIIEFLGRADRQIKIRGYRIEPDEIKSVLLKQPGINEAVVTVRKEKSGPRLIAYFTKKENHQIENLRNDLKGLLPSYMVPSALVELDEFPRLPNGKIKEQDLSPPNENANRRSLESLELRTTTERNLAKIWGEVLKNQHIGRDDNFFDIGGDSILSIRIVAKARQAGFSLAANQIFEQQTIAELATALDSTDKKSTDQSLKISDLPEINRERFPLSFMQQAFLLHHLTSPEDQGFLQLEFSIKGKIDPETWEAAWRKTAEIHPVLKTRIEFENAAKPMQVIDKNAGFDWEYFDWKNQSAGDRKISLQNLRQVDRDEKLDLSAAPVGRMKLIEIDENQYLFFWTCHHILLDGWSGGILLKEVLDFYKKIKNNESIEAKVLPTYADYLHWENEQQTDDAAAFWKEYFEGFELKIAFEDLKKQSGGFQNLHLAISTTQSDALRAFAQKNRITLNTLLKGIWGLLLSKYLDTDSVTFGTTVSGRNADFPNMDELAGLFMNVLPTRISIDPSQKTGDWLRDFQQKQTKAGSFERSTEEQISTWSGLPKHQPIFDNLFVFGNFMKDGLQIGDLKIDDFHGGFTSTYPLTVRVNPTASLGFDFRYDSAKVSEEAIGWFEENLKLVFGIIEESGKFEIGDSRLVIRNSGLVNRDSAAAIPPITRNLQRASDNYLAPRTPTELTLTKIWENLFGFSPIGVADNFFDIGGKSILAMRLFAQIEEEFGKALPPPTLLQHPTIEKLAKLISGKSETEAWKTIVPMRASGSKPPIFCIHAGGAHVFFYGGLAKYMDTEQPIYAIQPRGLDGAENYHASIEEMATSYLEEVRKVQPEGPYHLLGHCFSNAVCLEMANQLHAEGEPVSMYIVDSAPAHLIPLEAKKPVRRFLKILADQNWGQLYRKLRRRYLIIRKKVVPRKLSGAEIQLQKMVKSLNSVYAAYSWKPFAGKVTLIRSSQFASDYHGKKFHLTQWEKLAQGGLDVHVVEGKHITIFDEPAVEGLANQLQECLIKNLQIENQ